MSLAEIHAAIPHRAAVSAARRDRRARRASGSSAARRFAADEYFYAGHYPGFPLTPGVLLCEAAMQAGAVLLVAATCEPAGEGGVPVATRMNDVRFKRMVKPGETIEIEVELNERLADAFFLKAKVTLRRQTGRAVRVRLHAGPAPSETTRIAAMDFLELAGKTVLVLGVANRKSVAWHVGQLARPRPGPKSIYSVRSPARQAGAGQTAARGRDSRLRRRASRADLRPARRVAAAHRPAGRAGPFDRVCRLRGRSGAVSRDAQGGVSCVRSTFPAIR